ncbi:MAG: GIY-YIG nuclease family protein [Proteobacteria bacterium]|nr:GIY-YIG nuclease family protein [Pseudomonadota bacterium]
MTSQTKDDRKALIREYKQTPKEMGVYLIRNTANQKCYVASSRDITARFNRHRMELRTNSERAPGLQQDWNQFGEAAFEFEKLDVLEPSKQADYNPTDDLQVLEDLWLEKLQPFAERGYNKKPA